jgi:hypothetical protein
MSRLPEQRAWDSFSCDIDPAKLKLFRVENQCVDGMCDVIGINRAGVSFWLENKALADWPAKSKTYPLLGAFEPGQVPFMRQWKWWNGRAFVLLRVSKEYYLLDPDLELKAMTADQLVTTAIAIGKKPIYHLLESLE